MTHFVETKHRRISTPVPHPDDLELLEELRKVESDAVPKQLPIWLCAYEYQVYDNHDNMFLDFTSGIFVTNTGHGNERVHSAIEKMSTFHTYSFLNKHRINFLKKLIEITPAFAEKACLFSAGTEATEAVISIMERWSIKSGNDDSIMALKGAMHGNTHAAKRLSGRKQLKRGIDGFYTSPDLADMINVMNFAPKDMCGIILESYEGWSAKFHNKKDIKTIVKQAHDRGIIICFDEIQGGFGRTGKMFAYEHYDVEPDLVCLGKGLTGSLPVSAVIGRAKYMDCLPEGELGSTHSGNPVGCAAGLANLEEFSKDDFKIVEDSRVKGELLHEHLNLLKDEYPEFITEVNGHGLLAAIITKTKEQSDRVCELAKQRGLLLVHTGRESIKIGPPLTIPTDALLEGIEVIVECFGELKND